jgi:uncharacterized protein YbjT (DUF2867 family)
MRVLISGATGYIGSELLRKLHSSAYIIRCLVRDPTKIRIPGNKLIEIYKGDLLSIETIQKAFAEVDVAFYLVHSMDSEKEFERLEFDTATNFARAAAESGVKRIIYLGALGSEDEGTLSSHLKSRKRVGNILRSSGIQVIEFQASIILGAGSLSYEMIKALSERLPVMIMPRWVGVKAQPIATTDVLEYLTQAIELKVDGNRIFEIGGPEQLSYKELIQEYCRQRSLKRLLIPVPVLTPWLSSLWLALVTPTFACVGKKLILSIKNPTLVKDGSALSIFNTIKPMKVSEAIAIALRKNKK